MTDPLPAWRDRQPDYANLFNPAFVGLLLRASCEGYTAQDEADRGMPFALSFVAVPLALSPAVRRDRPPTTKARVSKWFRDHPAIKAEFGAAAHSLAPIVREAIIMMVRSGLIAVDAAHLRSVGTVRRFDPTSTGEHPVSGIDAYLTYARFIGRWLATGPGVAAIFEAAGAKP